MCGIGGFVEPGTTIGAARIAASLGALHHRGPDAEGQRVLRTDSQTVCLLHCRLSIIDLSERSDQPMESRDGRFVLTFNGEIYNYIELRDELVRAGFHFETASDTEVLLYAWAHWGRACLGRLRGMFSFVILDTSNARLYAARDAFGIKPLFYVNERHRFFFASELPALQHLVGEPLTINRTSVAQYLIYGDYDIGAETFVESVAALPPGHILDLALVEEELRPSVTRWWNPEVDPEQEISFRDAALEIRDLFLKSIRQHLRSDVPIGFALSGGIDSSAVVCAARYLEPDLEIRTFSYLSDELGLDESDYANLVNDHVKAKPYRVMPTAASLTEDLEELVGAQGEPFGSTSIYAQFAVFRAAAAQGMKVIMDGQGADEVFAGYQGFPASRIQSMIDRRQVSEAFQFVRASGAWPGRSATRVIAQALLSYLPPRLRHQATGVIGTRAPDRWLHDSVVARRALPSRSDRPRGRQLVAELRRQLTGNGGLASLLRHADRNSMHFSIENRVPFLDLDLVEFSLRLPEKYLVSQHGRTKHIFRAAMEGIVPDEILQRRDKLGFQTPDASWVRGALSEGSLRVESLPSALLDVETVRRELDEWLHGDEAGDARWWRLLNLASWLTYLGEAGLVRI